MGFISLGEGISNGDVISLSLDGGYGIGSQGVTAGQHLGAELVVNGDFGTGDLTGWTTPAGNWSVINNEAVMGLTSSYTPLRGNPVLTEGESYLISLSVIAIATGGIIKITAQNPAFNSIENNAVDSLGEHSFILTGQGAGIDIARQNTTSATIDNVSARQVIED